MAFLSLTQCSAIFMTLLICYATQSWATIGDAVKKAGLKRCTAATAFKTKLIHGKSLDGSVYESMNTKQEGICRVRCYENNRCLSYNYIATGKTCELSESDHVTKPEKLVARSGSIYSSVQKSRITSNGQVCYLKFENNMFREVCTAWEPTTAKPTTATDCEIKFQKASTANYVKMTSAFSKDLESFTLTFWIKVPSSYTGTLAILSYKTDSFSTNNQMSVCIKSDGRTEVSINGNIKSFNSGFVRDNNWQHFIITRRRSNGATQLYRNGVQKESASDFAKSITVKSGGVLYLGKMHGDSSKLMEGGMADLHIWHNRVGEDTAKKVTSWRCETTKYYNKGQVLAWDSILNSDMQGAVIKTCPASCHS